MNKLKTKNKKSDTTLIRVKRETSNKANQLAKEYNTTKTELIRWLVDSLDNGEIKISK